MMSKVFCFGELLLRMSPSLDRQWIREESMPVYIGGAELNVATALAAWNVPVKYMTVLPENYLSHEIIEELKGRNVDTSAIRFGGERIGLYFLPKNADLKNTSVIYDRDYSSFASLQPGMIDWEEKLKDSNWFHFSAICPALNENIATICREALEAASKRKMKISIDLNYRSRLWKYRKKPSDVMSTFLPYCDVVMGNIWATEALLGIPAGIRDSVGLESSRLGEAAMQNISQLQSSYPNVATIGYTFRLEKNYFGILKFGQEIAVSKEFILNNVPNRIGSGDSFMAGLIYGLLNQHSGKNIVDFAAAAAVGKMQEAGDHTRQSVEMVKKLL